MTTYLGKSCSFCLPRVPFVNCRQFMYLVISLLVLRAGYGIWLYQFLIIAYLFTFQFWKKKQTVGGSIHVSIVSWGFGAGTESYRGRKGMVMIYQLGVVEFREGHEMKKQGSITSAAPTVLTFRSKIPSNKMTKTVFARSDFSYEVDVFFIFSLLSRLQTL